MKRAYAWLRNCLVGCFFEGPDGAIRFEYSPKAAAPISLSLPLDGSWRADAPSLFLDGLLPDDDGRRAVMQRCFGAASTDPIDLLVAADVTGGLCFTSVPELGEIASQAREFARVKDLELKSYRLRHDRGSWQADDGRSRFALAGSQGKFALERFGNRWAWPNAKHPSTHVVKPDSYWHPGTPSVEDATMHLAAACGLDVARSSVLSFGEERVYVVERFDRKVLPDGQVERLHVEDLTQALGIPRGEKYTVTAADVFGLLKRQLNGDALVKEWAKQLAFNTLVGNCDAHGKNYSLFLREDGSVELCPLYDTVCTLAWPYVSDDLAMPINCKRKARDVSLFDWAVEAKASGVCAVDVVETVKAIAARLVESVPAVLAKYPDDVRKDMTKAISANNETFFRELGL